MDNLVSSPGSKQPLVMPLMILPVRFVDHGVGGWLALGAVLMLGARHGRYGDEVGPSALIHTLAGTRVLDALRRLVRL